MRIAPHFAAILLLPVFFGAGTAAGAGHTESLVLGDFGGMALDNMTLRPDGAAELASDPRDSAEVQLTGRAEEELCPAAAGPDGTVYVAYRYFSANDDIYFLKLDSRLEPEGAAVGVCAGVPGNKDTPGIAVDSNGNCIVAWEDCREGLQKAAVFARRLDPRGQLAGPEFRVSGSGDAGDPRVAFWPDGGFVIAWDEMRNQSSTYTDIYARNFKFDGTPDGPEIPVYIGPNHQFSPALAVLPSGKDFAVAWSDQSSPEVVGFRHLARNGTGATWLRIGSGVGSENWPEMAIMADPAGRLAVTWLRSDGGEMCVVCARKFDFNGTPDGPEIQIGRSEWQRSAKTAAGPDGGLAVAWTEDFVYARHFSPDLVPIGDRVRLSQSNGTMISPDIVPAGRDNYAVLWTDDRRGPTNEDLYARFLLPEAVYRPSGLLDTGALRPGPGFIRWGSVKAEATLEDPAANSVSLECLRGDAWVPVPADGSLEAAGNASTVRLRVRLATTDNSSSPVLRRLTVNFVSNSAPSVTVPPHISMFLGDAINITAGGSDPDGDLLTFIWTPPEGPAPAGTNQSQNVLWFRPAETGQYLLTVRASDGLCESAPAPVVINVTERPVPPGCIIDSPENGSAVAGLFEVSGRAVRGSLPIEAVEVRVDGGPWRPAVGLGNWSFSLDSRGLRNGRHTIEARARDGALSGGEAVMVIVRNPSTSVTMEQFPWWILALVIVIAVLYILVHKPTRRKVQGGQV